MGSEQLVSERGASLLFVCGDPLPTLAPQVAIGKPWLWFRFAWWRFAVAIVPLDLENVMANYATLTRPPSPEQPK